MVRRIVLEIEGTKAIAVMHDKSVPKTCDAIWNMLPLEGMAISAAWAGREIMLHLEGEKYLKLEKEGLPVIYRGPRDIVYFYRGPRVLFGKQKAYANQFQRELAEIAIFYGVNPSVPRDPARSGVDGGLITRIHFATFEDIPEDFYLKCESIRFGRKKLIIERLEEQRGACG